METNVVGGKHSISRSVGMTDSLTFLTKDFHNRIGILSLRHSLKVKM